MKKLLMAAASIATLMALTIPASATDATTFTVNTHGPNLPFATDKPCTGTPDNPNSGVLGLVTSSGNGVFHITINATGFWVTGTNEGTFLFQPISNAVVIGPDGKPVLDSNGNFVLDPPTPQVIAGAVTIAGHFAAWFGDENNLNNGVQHFTTNILGTDSTGQPFSAHIVGHFSTSASTPPNINAFFNGTCS